MTEQEPEPEQSVTAEYTCYWLINRVWGLDGRPIYTESINPKDISDRSILWHQ